MCIYMALYAHIFKPHFSPPFDRYNNRLTVHVYTIARSSMVCFPRPVSRPGVLLWPLSHSNLPGQADSQQGIVTRQTSETGHQCSYILWYVGLKTAWIDAIGPYKYFLIRATHHFVTTHHPYRGACGKRCLSQVEYLFEVKVWER